MRTCTRCGETKPLDQFPPVRRGEPKLQTWCRGCFAEVNARNYRRDHARQKARLLRNTTRRREEARRRAIEYLRTHPCVDCGETDIVVLEFDHLRDKSYDIGTMIATGQSWPLIDAEIAKCEVRCANCHRLKTAKERSYRKRLRGPRYEPIAIAGRLGLPLAVDTPLDSVETQKCRRCGITKPIAEFHFRSKTRGMRHRLCRSCKSAYHRDWWATNRIAQMPRIRRNRKKRDEELERLIWDYLSTHACVDCGESDPLLLEFDHRRDKIAEVSIMWRRQLSWSTIMTEIEKCEVRCANCHRRRTSRELGSYRTKAL